MARIDWITARLKTWGAWKARREDNGLGFPTVNILLSAGGGRGSGYRETIVPASEIEAAETDRAIESLKFTKSHLYLTLQHIYVRNAGVKGTAHAMRRAESTIKAQLEQADAELARWFEARREQAEAAKRSFTP